jgi:hypothetical protein
MIAGSGEEGRQTRRTMLRFLSGMGERTTFCPVFAKERFMMAIGLRHLRCCAVTIGVTTICVGIAYAGDTPPTRAVVAAEYVDLLTDLAGFQSKGQGDSQAKDLTPMGDLARDRLTILRKELSRIDKRFRQADGFEGEGPADPALISVNRLRKLPRDRLADISAQLKDYQNRLGQMSHDLEAACDKLDREILEKTTSNMAAGLAAASGYRALRSGRARAYWCDKQSGRPIGPASRGESLLMKSTEYQKAVAKQQLDRQKYIAQRQCLVQQMRSLKQLQKMSDWLIVPVIAAKDRHAR